MEEDATIKAGSRCHIDLEKTITTAKTEKGFLTNSITESMSPPTLNGAKCTRTGDVIFETILSMHLGFTFRLDKNLFSCCSKEISELFIYFRNTKRLRRRGENVQ